MFCCCEIQENGNNPTEPKAWVNEGYDQGKSDGDAGGKSQAVIESPGVIEVVNEVGNSADLHKDVSQKLNVDSGLAIKSILHEDDSKLTVEELTARIARRRSRSVSFSLPGDEPETFNHLKALDHFKSLVDTDKDEETKTKSEYVVDDETKTQIKTPENMNDEETKSEMINDETKTNDVNDEATKTKSETVNDETKPQTETTDNTNEETKTENVSVRNVTNETGITLVCRNKF